jgi:hypothetical protein
VFNPTKDTILLLGRLSSAVDPAGQSHPLAEQTIAPASYVKLILPPMRPRLEPSGPTIGIGFGAVGYRDETPAWAGPGYRYEPANQPRYLYVEDPGSAMYWDWEGETDVRLTLVYRRGESQFRHEFTFHRRRV